MYTSVGKQKGLCMKKTILVFVIMIFSGLSVSAAQVFYSITGHPSYVSYSGGTYTRSINNWGTNAPFITQNRMAAPGRMRARQFARTYAENMANRGMGRYNYPPVRNVRTTYSEPSRFDKNYKISSGRRYIRNGITYYD